MSRAAIAGFAAAAAVVAAVVFAAGLGAGGDEMAVEATHALLVLDDGSLVAETLATGERQELAAAPHAHADVIDFAAGSGGTIEDFTAIAYDDGSGPLGFLTYARRAGGSVRVNFVATERLPGSISNRGYRTIAPDGRWLAYGAVNGDGASTTLLVPLAADTGQPLPDEAIELPDVAAPVTWTGDTAEDGDISRLTSRTRDGYTQVVLERRGMAFEARSTAELATEHGDRGPALVAFANQRPAGQGGPRLDLVVRRGSRRIGEPPGADVAVLRRLGQRGEPPTAHIELGPAAGNVVLRAHGRHALVVVDGVLEPDLPENHGGRAFLLHATGGRFSDPVRLAGGPVGGALLGGPERE